MKLIKIEFLTEKGKNTYKEIFSIKQSFKERLIINNTFKESIINDNKIEISVKIPWLAERIKLDETIIKTMSLKDCERDLDYIMEVE